MAANRLDMVQARSDTMKEPSENPLAYTREVSMHWVDSIWSSMAVTNWRSGLVGFWLVVSHWAGFPVPWGKATTNPSCCPRTPNWVVSEWMTAPSARPWKSRTSGRAASWVVEVVEGRTLVGLGVLGAGVSSRYQRAAPSTVRFWRRLVTEGADGWAHPEEGTGAPPAT